MKSISKMMSMMVLMTIIAFSANAGTGNSIKKAKEAVETAEPYDWKTLAESAKVCLSKKQNVEQALEWIDKSISLNKDPMNLEIKADYYASINQRDKALELYYEAINAGKAQNFWFDSTSLQQKIWDIK